MVKYGPVKPVNVTYFWGRVLEQANWVNLNANNPTYQADITSEGKNMIGYNQIKIEPNRLAKQGWNKIKYLGELRIV